MLDSGSEESGLSNLENRFMVKAAQLHKDSLARQFHFGIFYSWVKLRELEVNNLMWIAEVPTCSKRGKSGFQFGGGGGEVNRAPPKLGGLGKGLN